jgi:hypothetical protein
MTIVVRFLVFLVQMPHTVSRFFAIRFLHIIQKISAFRMILNRLLTALRSLLRALGTGLAALVGLALLVISLQYASCPIYDFPAARPFVGRHWFNPYRATTLAETLAGGRWYKCNFHAHSKAWGGLTNGHQPAAEVYAAYKQLGYDVVGISNYHSITNLPSGDSHHDSTNAPTNTLCVPVYEHGYNIKKSHRLAIGAREVVWLDFPLGQTLHHKQHIVLRLRQTAELVAIAHPRFVGGHPPENFRFLTGYDFVEVLNHFRTSDEHWDSCLSAGHAKWILADDDTHDIRIAEETGAFWTMVQASERTANERTTNERTTNERTASGIYAALRAGRHYGVRGANATNDNPLQSVVVHSSTDGTALGRSPSDTLGNTLGDTMTVRLHHAADSIVFIGQRGIVRQTSYHAASASYLLKPEDTYIRTVIYNPHSTLYLNPVLRYDGIHPPNEPEILATVNIAVTWAFRAACGAGYGILVWLVIMAIRARQQQRRHNREATQRK